MNIKALQKLSYGVYVVCSKKGEALNGQIANSVMQLASEPPVISVCINKQNLTHEFISESKVFSASILGQDTPMTFIGRFGFRSGRNLDKLAGVKYITGGLLVPVVLENSVAYLEVRVTNQVDARTHTLFIGELVDADIINEKPCMTYAYYHEVKRGKTPVTAPNYIKELA
jgi:ferric-chelate reductase [NAD(P)H]